MDGMHFPLKKWAVRAIQSHIDTHYIEMMSMNHTTNFNHIMQIANLNFLFWRLLKLSKQYIILQSECLRAN